MWQRQEYCIHLKETCTSKVINVEMTKNKHTHNKLKQTNQKGMPDSMVEGGTL